jgi:hypothetical protein
VAKAKVIGHESAPRPARREACQWRLSIAPFDGSILRNSWGPVTMRYFGILACAAFALPLAASAQSPFVTNSVQQTLNVNDPLNHTYQQEKSTRCSLAGNCEIFFPKVQHMVLIQHVACFIVKSGSSNPPSEAVLSNNLQNVTGANQLQVFYFNQNTFVTTDYNFGINTDTDVIVLKGNVPTISVVISEGTMDNLDCTLSGYHN